LLDGRRCWSRITCGPGRTVRRRPGAREDGPAAGGAVVRARPEQYARRGGPRNAPARARGQRSVRAGASTMLSRRRARTRPTCSRPVFTSAGRRLHGPAGPAGNPRPAPSARPAKSCVPRVCQQPLDEIVGDRHERAWSAARGRYHSRSHGCADQMKDQPGHRAKAKGMPGVPRAAILRLMLKRSLLALPAIAGAALLATRLVPGSLPDGPRCSPPAGISDRPAAPSPSARSP